MSLFSNVQGILCMRKGSSTGELRQWQKKRQTHLQEKKAQFQPTIVLSEGGQGDALSHELYTFSRPHPV